MAVCEKTTRYWRFDVRGHSETRTNCSLLYTRREYPVASRPKKRVGAYPVKYHLTCAEKTRKNTSYDLSLTVEPPDGLAHRMAAGVEFEQEQVALQVEKLGASGMNVVTFDVATDKLKKLNGHDCDTLVVNFVCSTERSGETRDANEVATLYAMDRGARYILGARLTTDSLAGEPDALARSQKAGQRAGFSKWTYEGVDYKHHLCFDAGKTARAWNVSDLKCPWTTSSTVQTFSGTPHLVDSLQLAMYWHLLDYHGRAGEKTGGIIGKEGVVVWRPLDAPLYRSRKVSAMDVWDEAHTSYRGAVKAERARIRAKDGRPPASRPELKPACAECEWRVVCREELEESRDITLLPDMTVKRAAVHRENGIDRIDDLARLHWKTATLVDSGVPVAELMATAKTLDPETGIEEFASTKHVAALKDHKVETASDTMALCVKTARYTGSGIKNLAAAIDQARVTKAQRVHRARGVEHVEIPRAAVELDVDIEDNAGDICYLIGVRETIRSRGEQRSRYIPFVTWDNTPQGEATMFAEFWAYVQKMQAKARDSKMGAFRAFYYTEHETRYFLHLAKTHAGHPGVPTVEQIAEFTASDQWVDMHPIVGKQLVWPTEDRKLKSLAKYVRFFWRDESPSGANSVAWYNEAVTTDDPDRAEELRVRLLEYNEDDVEATYVLREWISRFGETRKPGTKLPSVQVLDKRFGKRA